MTISRFRALLAALMLAFTMSVAFTGCSSSEEEPPPDSGSGCYKGDEGRCCDIDAMQPGCEDYQPDF
jgi:hypothetical protein